MPISDWADMMPHTVTLAPRTGLNDHGEPTYGTAVSYQARVSYRSHKVRGPDGEDVMARGAVWLQSTALAKVTDRLVLPEGETPAVILAVEKHADEAGGHHVKIHFG